MKSLATIILSFLAITLLAQSSGVINYSETMKLNIVLDSEETGGIDLSEFLPKSMSSQKQLTFDGKLSSYKDVSSNDESLELGGEEEGVKIIVMEDDLESVLYVDHSTKLSIEQKGFMGRSFIVEEPVEKLKWKITSDKVKYLDYECIKATRVNEEGKLIVAWFAPRIPASIGPLRYGQLPGAILMLSEGDEDLVIKATKIELIEVGQINKPTNGKIVTNEEYEIMVEEKTKEMMQLHGGSTIQIGH